MNGPLISGSMASSDPRNKTMKAVDKKAGDMAAEAGALVAEAVAGASAESKPNKATNLQNQLIFGKSFIWVNNK